MPFDIGSTRRPRHVAEPDQRQQLGALGGAAVEPARRWCRRSSSSAVAQPGKRKSSAR